MDYTDNGLKNIDVIHNSWGVALYMSRPKGSKNKKTLLYEAQLDDRIAAAEVAKRKLAEEERKLMAAMEDMKVQLKAKKKELRAAERTLTALREKKRQADAVAAEAAQKKEIEAVVKTLVSSGRSADEILDMLKS